MAFLLLSENKQLQHQIRTALLKHASLSSTSIDASDSLGETIHKLTVNRYQMFIVDVASLDEAPIEVLIRIRAYDSKTPILILNNSGFEKIAIQCLRHGAQHYLIMDENWLKELSLTVDNVLEEFHHKNSIKKYISSLEAENRHLKSKELLDDSTMFYSSNHFESLLSRELKRATRYGHHLACLVLDIREKVAGSASNATDQLYDELGLLLKSIVRSCDIWARLSQDQFAALLPHTNLKQANQAVRRLRSELEDGTMRISQRDIPLELRWGLAKFDKNKIKNEQELLERARQAIK